MISRHFYPSELHFHETHSAPRLRRGRLSSNGANRKNHVTPAADEKCAAHGEHVTRNRKVPHAA